MNENKLTNLLDILNKTISFKDQVEINLNNQKNYNILQYQITMAQLEAKKLQTKYTEDLNKLETELNQSKILDWKNGVSKEKTIKTQESLMEKISRLALKYKNRSFIINSTIVDLESEISSFKTYEWTKNDLYLDNILLKILMGHNLIRTLKKMKQSEQVEKFILMIIKSFENILEDLITYKDEIDAFKIGELEILLNRIRQLNSENQYITDMISQINTLARGAYSKKIADINTIKAPGFSGKFVFDKEYITQNKDLILQLVNATNISYPTSTLKQLATLKNNQVWNNLKSEEEIKAIENLIALANAVGVITSYDIEFINYEIVELENIKHDKSLITPKVLKKISDDYTFVVYKD